MQEKLKQLELLVTQALSRQKDLQGENASLKARLRSLEGGVEKLKETETELRSLKEWKRNTQAVLRRLSGRLEKEIAKAQEEEKKIV
jgi:peptidoglycan hydrolase CwlO-like protein